MRLDLRELRGELARRGLTQGDLARQLAVPATTLGSWLLERHPAPDDLADRIESALGLEPGTLAQPNENGGSGDGR